MAKEYVLNTNAQARSRLDLQHQFYAEASVGLLARAGVSSGMSGLEIGCGSGAMTLELARIVGNKGQLLATDFSPDQVHATALRCAGFPQVRTQVANVLQLDQIDQTFDFIYCRMVLHHLPLTNQALKQMQARLKPGGLMIIEEPSLFDSVICQPQAAAIGQWAALVQACFDRNQKDYQIAYTMPQRLANIGMQIVHLGVHEPLLWMPDQKQIYPLSLADISGQLLELNLLCPAELDQLSNALMTLVHDETILSWIRMHHVIARR